jgi:hypothetical protein
VPPTFDPSLKQNSIVMKTLRNVLLVNALSSGATGIGLVVMSTFISRLFDRTETLPFIAVGLFLVAFATLVFIVARMARISRSVLQLIIVLDSSWVVVSVFILLFQAFNLSTTGYVLIGAVAAWVALMASLQFRGLQVLSNRSVEQSQ